MSEVIVRMEMPKTCGDCPISCFRTKPCALNAEGTAYDMLNAGKKGKRPDWCPIICQLPEGHGRLIDASTIIGEVDAGYTDDYGNPIPVNRPVSVDEYLGLEVPTIVPATEEAKHENPQHKIKH